MDAKIKADLVQALRGGKYEQITGILRCDGKFCCLGVLCDVMGAKWRNLGDADLHGEFQSFYLGPRALAAAGLTEEQQEVLYRMNDDGKSFAEIADHIEANL